MFWLRIGKVQGKAASESGRRGGASHPEHFNKEQDKKNSHLHVQNDLTSLTINIHVHGD